MNYLDHLADEIRKAGGKTMPWQSLRNVHFRGDDPIGQVEAWAQKERLRASFDYQEESPTTCCWACDVFTVESNHLSPLPSTMRRFVSECNHPRRTRSPQQSKVRHVLLLRDSGRDGVGLPLSLYEQVRHCGSEAILDCQSPPPLSNLNSPAPLTLAAAHKPLYSNPGLTG
jgi:hypothetical protein